MKAPFFAIALMSVACSAGSSWDLDRPNTGFESTPTPGSSTAQGSAIGGAGGKVMTSGGSGVTIPARALSSTVAISVTEVSSPPALSEGSPVGPTFLFGPEGQTFDQPVTITVEFDPSKLDPGETAQDVVIYTSPKENPVFTPVETSQVDATHVAALASHFSYYVAVHGALASGEYVSTATDVGDSAYIGNWENSWGYVLGYFVPGSKVYAQYTTYGSVYGLITGGYGAWDLGHHCGWVPIGKGVNVRGSGSHSNVGDTCPAWNNSFSLASGEGPGTGPHQDPTMFRKDSWVNCNGCVQGAVVLPTCSDFTVYANYEPLTKTFYDADGSEVAYRGSVWSSTDSYVSKSGVKAQTGYSGFGTRFVSADNYAVEIKDTQRPGSHVTAFGFMHADCIAGSQVGDPAGVAVPTSRPTCGVLEAGGSLGADGEVMACGRQYWLTLSSTGELAETQYDQGILWDVKGVKGDRLDMQTDGNLVLYSGTKAIWATMTNNYPGAYLAVQDDGNLVVYYGGNPVWARF